MPYALISVLFRGAVEACVVPPEIVVVDDGSSDGGCDRPWPSLLRVIEQADTGIAPARNRGALAATQPFLVFLDAHCTVESDWLDPLLDGLRRHPGAVVGAAVRDAAEPRFVGCGAEIVDELFTYRWRRAVGSSTVEVGIPPTPQPSSTMFPPPTYIATWWIGPPGRWPSAGARGRAPAVPRRRRRPQP